MPKNIAQLAKLGTFYPVFYLSTNFIVILNKTAEVAIVEAEFRGDYDRNSIAILSLREVESVSLN